MLFGQYLFEILDSQVQLRVDERLGWLLGVAVGPAIDVAF